MSARVSEVPQAAFFSQNMVRPVDQRSDLDISSSTSNSMAPITTLNTVADYERVVREAGAERLVVVSKTFSPQTSLLWLMQTCAVRRDCGLVWSMQSGAFLRTLFDLQLTSLADCPGLRAARWAMEAGCLHQVVRRPL